jgi:hypothetical protein
LMYSLELYKLVVQLFPDSTPSERPGSLLRNPSATTAVAYSTFAQSLAYPAEVRRIQLLAN